MTAQIFVATLGRSGVWTLHLELHGEDTGGMVLVTAAEWEAFEGLPRCVCGCAADAVTEG